MKPIISFVRYLHPLPSEQRGGQDSLTRQLAIVNNVHNENPACTGVHQMVFNATREGKQSGNKLPGGAPGKGGEIYKLWARLSGLKSAHAHPGVQLPLATPRIFSMCIFEHPWHL